MAMAKKRSPLKAAPTPLESKERVSALQQEIFEKIASTYKLYGGAFDPDASHFLFQLETFGIFKQMLKFIEAERALIYSYIESLKLLTFEERRAVKERYKAYEETEELKSRPDLSDPLVPATYDEYVALFHELYPDLNRDLLSGIMMYRDPVTKRWSAAANHLSEARSYCMDEDRFAHTRVDDHFESMQGHWQPKLLVTIPEWDGIDRIEQIVSCFNLNNSNLSPVDVYELILDWGVKMWKRIEEPWIRNRFLIFQGQGNIGKDWAIDALIGGLNEPGLGYVRSTRIDDSGEINLKLHKAVVFKVSEFDRTYRASVGTLKHLIDEPESDERLKHAKESESRICRASFIASANPEDLLRDHTGNSKFIIIKLIGPRGEAIDFSKKYPGLRGAENYENDRKQIIAQYVAFAKRGFEASRETEKNLEKYLQFVTPDDPTKELLHFFDEWCSRKYRSDPVTFSRDWMANYDLSDFFIDANRQFKYSRVEVQRRLKLSERERRTNKSRGYAYNYLEVDMVQDDGGFEEDD